MADDPPRVFRSFSQRLTGLIMLLLLISLVTLVVFWYTTTLSAMNEEYVARQDQIDQILLQSVTWIDRGLALYESQYIPSLRRAMDIYQARYAETGGDIPNLHLTRVKEEISKNVEGEWELYLINETGVVVLTTFPADYHLDFKIWPSLYRKITTFRENGTFVPDRTVRGSANVGAYRKFAYMGTPDRRYVLELSRTFDRLLPNASKASYTELITNLPVINPAITKVTLYNSEYEVVSWYAKDDSPYRADPAVISRVRQVFKQRASSVDLYPELGEEVRYTFLPVEDVDVPSSYEMNLVARIVYSTKEHEAEALEVTLVCILYLVLTAVIAVLGSFLVSRYLSRPILRIVEDINLIASGDLDHPIRSTGSSEFQQIENAIIRLVENLKGKISDLKIREEELMDELGKRWRAEENYRRLFESAHEAIFTLQDTKILNCNNSAAVFLGKERQEIIGKNISVFSPRCQDDGTDSEVKMKKIISQALMGNAGLSDWIFVRSDGVSIETEMHVTAVISGDSVVLMAIFRDVSEIREMRRREIRSIVQLEENLVQLATINDQIRNPLGIITMLNDMQGGEYAETIHAQIRAIDALIHEVDKQFVETDKVRMFLMKHYGVHPEDNHQEDE